MSQNARILIVEDVLHLLHAMSHLLKTEGYEVFEAQTGTEGIRLAQQCQPDLILLNVGLPDINSIEVCRRLKTDRACPTCHIVLLSGIKTSPKNQIEGLESGTHDYIVRPISDRELLARVRVALRLKQAEDELRHHREHVEKVIKQRTAELHQANEQLRQEIKDRKDAEAALKQSEERFRLLYERAPLGYQSLDEAGCFLEVNQAWLDTLGYDRKEVIGHWFGEFLAPEFVEHFHRNFPRFKAVGEISGVEFEMVKKDGTHILVSFDGKIGYDAHHRFQQTHCIFHDVTDQKQTEEVLRASEARYRELFDNMSSGVAVYQAVDDGQDFVFTDFNRAGERIDSVEKSAIIGKRLTHIFPGVKEFGLFDVLVRVWHTGSPEIFPATMYQDERLMGWRTNYVYKLPSGEVVAVYDDITEQKQAEFELQKAKEAADEARIATEKANRKLLEQQQQIQTQNQQLQDLISKKDKFFSIIAHDLKTPISSFQSFINLFSQNVEMWKPGEIQHLVESLRENVENLSALLDNLLTWGRLEQGRLELYPQIFDIEALVERNVALLTPMAEQKHIHLHSSVNQHTFVHVDLNTIDTVIRNLLSNAVKFTHPEGSVTISAKQDDNIVIIAVVDTGIGMDSDMLDNLFRIDVQHQKVGTAGEKGTGLGLILCKEFVEKNGGHIWVESIEDRGSTFYFTLPVYKSDQA